MKIMAVVVSTLLLSGVLTSALFLPISVHAPHQNTLSNGSTTVGAMNRATLSGRLAKSKQITEENLGRESTITANPTLLKNAESVFHFARLYYQVNSGSMYPYLDGYKFALTDYHDGAQTEGSDSKPMDDSLTEILRRTTSIEVGSPAQPRLKDNIFEYPLLYVVEAEQLSLKTYEARRLREYIDRGGMIWMDDFHSVDEWNHVMRNIRKILPSAQPEPIPLHHELFHAFYDIKEILQACWIDLGRQCTRDPEHCFTGEEPDDFPDIEGIYYDGRLAIILTHGFDIGDSIEWIEDPEYPVRFSRWGIEFTTNVIVYALTH